MAARSEYLIHIKAQGLTANVVPANAKNVFFTHGSVYIYYSTVRQENHLQFAAEYTQKLKYILKTKHHIEIEELNLIHLLKDEEFYASSRKELFCMGLIRPRNRMIFSEEVLTDIYEWETDSAIYKGPRNHLGCIPFVARRDCGSLQQVAKEMHNILTMYSVYSDGILLTLYKGEIIYSTLYPYERRKS